MKKKKKLIDEALDIVNTHSYKVCEDCPKWCTTTCLPLEMFKQLLEKTTDEQLQCLENMKELFVEDG